MSFEPFAAPAATRDARPGVILWYRVYAGFMAMLCLALVVLSFVAMKDALLVATIGLGLGAFYAVAMMIPFKPWGWTVGLVAIAMGLASGGVVFAVPLLIYWFKPTVKAAFARF